MTLNRLPFETQAGNLSARETYKQLQEYLRLAEEDIRTLGLLARRRSNPIAETQWKAIADCFRRAGEVINHLGTNRLKTGVGYDR